MLDVESQSVDLRKLKMNWAKKSESEQIKTYH